MRRTESFFHSTDGLRLFFQQWGPEQAKANLVITHGLGEHSECYDQFANDLGEYDLCITAWDMRGHGRSQGPRGAISDIYQLTQDLEILLHFILRSQIENRPLILMGHSMGGLVLLKTILGLRQFIKTPLILSSPFLGVSLPVPPWKQVFSSMVATALPQLTLNNEIRFEDLTRDPDRIHAYESDPLRHDKISAGLFESALQAIESVFFHARAYAGPIHLLVSEQDPVVSTLEIRQFAKHFVHPQSRLVLYPDRRHEVLNDLGREESILDIRSFIEKQTGLTPRRRPYRNPSTPQG